MSSGLIFIQSILEEFFTFLFTTQIGNGLYLGWIFAYIIILVIILSIAFHG